MYSHPATQLAADAAHRAAASAARHTAATHRTPPPTLPAALQRFTRPPFTTAPAAPPSPREKQHTHCLARPDSPTTFFTFISAGIHFLLSIPIALAATLLGLLRPTTILDNNDDKDELGATPATPPNPPLITHRPTVVPDEYTDKYIDKFDRLAPSWKLTPHELHAVHTTAHDELQEYILAAERSLSISARATHYLLQHSRDKVSDLLVPPHGYTVPAAPTRDDFPPNDAARRRVPDDELADEWNFLYRRAMDTLVADHIHPRWKHTQVLESTPYGNVVMKFCPEQHLFVYWCDRTSLPHRILETVARKFAIQHDARPLVFHPLEEQEIFRQAQQQELHLQVERTRQRLISIARECGTTTDAIQRIFATKSAPDTPTPDVEQTVQYIGVRGNQYRYIGRIQDLFTPTATTNTHSAFADHASTLPIAPAQSAARVSYAQFRKTAAPPAASSTV